MELELVTYRAQQIGIGANGTTLSDTIRILEEYQFNCTSTNITSVILGIDVRTVRASPPNRRYRFPSIQLWRPNPDSPGQYLVDTDSERFIYYSTSNISTNGVFEYPLNPPISVNSGDLLAISQPTEGDSVVRVYYIDGINFQSREDSFGTTTSTGLSGTLHTDQLVLVYPITGTIISVNFYFTFVLTDGYCVNSSVNATLIKKNALLILKSRVRLKRQYIYPEMRFTCNGTITKWIYGGVQSSGTMLPELQIWRQLGTDNYNKIGSSLVTADTSIGTNLYEFIPQTPLEFQVGDIFGAHTPYRSESQPILYQQRESGPLNLQDPDNDGEDPLSTITEVQENGNDFPLVTVEISKQMNDYCLQSLYRYYWNFIFNYYYPNNNR